MAATRLTPFVDFLKSFGRDESDSDLLSRFSRLGDEAAFAEIVRRHGPAVLGVCRRVLRDDHAAEDAFQATFLLLATKASSLQHPELLANWLYAVAYRTATKLRGRLYRRRLREQPFDENAYVSPNAERELRPDLDSAIQRLPSKYRVPVVLCYLQGLTNAEAAERVGCPANTIATRLARARDRLRSQLTRQGLTVAVSSALIAAAARNAKALGAGATLSPNILTLMEGVRRAMFWNKVKIAVAAVALVAMAGLGVGRVSYRAGAGEPQRPGAASTPGQPQRVAPPLALTPDAGPNPGTTIPPVDLSAAEELTQNFDVTGADGETCRKIATAAEKHRKELALGWLGKELPNWSKPCPIAVKTDPGLGKSSATVFQFDKDFKIIGMTLQGPSDEILNNLLPHEIAHCILADHFRKPVPRWADEGAAMQSESETERNRQDTMVRRCLKEGKALRLSHLFSLNEYRNDAATFYAQSSSVTRFLAANYGPTLFVEFVGEAMEHGWDTAAKKIFKLETLDDMEHTWIAWLRKMGQTAPETRDPLIRTGESPKAPAPSIEPRANPPLQLADARFPDSATIPPPPLQPQPVAPLPSQLAATEPVGPPTPALPATSVPAVQPPPALGQSAPIASGPPRAAMGADKFVVVTVSMLEGGFIRCKFPKVTHDEVVTSPLPCKSGIYRFGVCSIRRTTQEECTITLDQVRFSDANGKAIDRADLARHLNKETPIVCVLSGSIDPNLLPLLKQGTLIMTVKGSQSPMPSPPATPR